MIGVRRWRFWALALLACAVVAPSWAHQQGSSYSRWQLTATPQVTVRISELDLTRAELHPQYTDEYDAKVMAYLQGHLRLWNNDLACAPQSGQFGRAEAGWLEVSWGFECALVESTQWLINSHILLAPAPGHLHFARLLGPQGNVDRLLTVRDNDWKVDSQTDQSSGFGHYLQLGVTHILEGWDHLAFVLGLLLLASRLRSLLWLVTGFTLGHSITLVLATVGWLQPNILFIEAVIAWSIALVAVEFCWQRQTHWAWLLLPLVLLLLGSETLPWALCAGLLFFTVGYFGALHIMPQRQNATRAAVTVSFGLIHGCGFAAVLSTLALPNTELASSLLGFNAGVEIGQLLVVGLAWPLLQWLKKQSPVWVNTIAIVLLGLASYWWVLRVV